ncbi:MAG: DNA polymerase I [Casimicrobiaceae bacterium]|nr:DNA polymerase I [Casimicrobiaceae bacterium]MDW8311482.1 DNA polymerase I [Burkholderiales bacterium]
MSDAPQKLVLVDGSSYLYRAFHAMPDLRTKAGEPTGAIRGVYTMLRQLVAQEAPDYFAVVFDAPGKTFREDWYPDYKANRAPMPEALAVQIEPLYAIVRASGWPLLIEAGVEADDVIGTLAREAERLGLRCLISTGDKDLAQLVSPAITLKNTMSSETLDEAGVIAKFGVRPEQMIDYLTLIGDSVDNVPGVDKVGPKTAAKWLAEHGSLDAIIARADTFSGAVGENLRRALPWLPQARRLLTIRCDVPLGYSVRDLRPRAADLPQLRALFERFEFRSLLKELPTASGTAAQNASALTAQAVTEPGTLPLEPSSETPAPPRRERRYRTILTEAELNEVIAAIETAALTCFDTETTSLEPMRARLVGLAFAWQPFEAVYIPLAHRYPGAPAQLPLEAVLERLKPWFEDASKKKLAQNAKYDEHVLANHGIQLAGLEHDTLLADYVLESHKPHDMDALAARFLNEQTLSYEQVAGKGAKQIGFDQVDIARATEYSAEDADVTLRLHHAIYPRIAADPKLDFVYRQIELPVREVLVRMERHGVLIDTALLARQSHELGQQIAALEQKAHELAGQPFNLGSPKQLGEILFGKLGLPVKRKTATGQPSTDEEVLTELAADYPLPKVILEHRALAKLKSTYTDKLPTMVNPATGRVHTHYAQATAVTGRLASNDPNLQNIPVRTPQGRAIRQAFIAPPGHLIVSADYSQIELRIMAHLSEDAALLEAFAKGLDIHKATASEIFGVPVEEVTPEQRRYTKAVNFGLIYGMGAFGLAQQLGIEKTAAQQFIDRYFARYPGVADYMQRIREFARAHGYVETVFGRRLTLTDINAASGPRRAAAERAAINAPMQGTAADLIKLAMIAVDRWLAASGLASRLIMQVHDELVFEVPEAEVETIRDEIPRLMTRVATLKVPLVAEVGVGANWEEAH